MHPATSRELNIIVCIAQQNERELRGRKMTLNTVKPHRGSTRLGNLSSLGTSAQYFYGSFKVSKYEAGNMQIQELLRLVLLGLLFSASRGDQNAPEQIHLAYTGLSSERIVGFVTPSPSVEVKPVVEYGTNPSELNRKSTGKSFVFGTDGHNFTIHNVKLTGLEPKTKYYYRVGAPGSEQSEVFDFSTKEDNLVYAVYGDLGYKNAVSLDRLQTEAKQGSYHAVLHVGDMAYDMYQGKGEIGDDFMNSIQPIAARVPYMALPGNHEQKYNFSHYINRFSNIALGVGKTSGSDTNLWYSFDLGLIHFVAFDTEVYSYSSDEGQIRRQLNWLRADLEKANQNRAKTPWIVSLAHKAWFMELTNFTDFSRLLHQYGVDLHLCGHSHNYQRFYPAYNSRIFDHQSSKSTFVNPKYVTTIVAGSAGSREKLSTGQGPKNVLINFILDYGYGHLQAINSTHLLWKWENAQSNIPESVRDSLLIIQEHHEMRPPITDDYPLTEVH